MTILESVEREAAAAHAAVPLLTDHAVASALALAAARLSAEHDRVLAANEADLTAAADLDEGALDRLRLDTGRLTAI
jgi:gamma-glutamyl phosphate reductase